MYRYTMYQHIYQNLQPFALPIEMTNQSHILSEMTAYNIEKRERMGSEMEWDLDLE